MSRAYEIELPWPPSVNAYWRTPKGAGRPIISERGREYRTRVIDLIYQARLPKLTGELRCEIEAFPPDRRKHDLDNLLKATLDALAHGGLYADDSQIKRLVIEERAVTAPGILLIRIGPRESKP